MTVTIETNSFFYETGLRSDGNFLVEVRAFTMEGTDTGTFEQLEINVVDPCVS